MTREEILSIEEYCAAHKVSHRKRLEELNIPFWQFYKAKKKKSSRNGWTPYPDASLRNQEWGKLWSIHIHSFHV